MTERSLVDMFTDSWRAADGDDLASRATRQSLEASAYNNTELSTALEALRAARGPRRQGGSMNTEPRMITTSDELDAWHDEALSLSNWMTGVVIDAANRPLLITEYEDGCLYAYGSGTFELASTHLQLCGPWRVLWPEEA